jgi:hypothetical protein
MGKWAVVKVKNVVGSLAPFACQTRATAVRSPGNFSVDSFAGSKPAGKNLRGLFAGGKMKLLRTLNKVDYLVIASMIMTIGGVLLSAALKEPRLYGVTAIIVIGMLIAGCRWTRSSRLAWLLSFGLLVGVLELWADWVHTDYFGSLVYTDYFGFKLLGSPVYMPVGWWLTSVQFGYWALRLSERWSRWKAVALITLLGMSLPPWYEEFAAPAKAWYYSTAGPMFSHTPLWIVFTYGGCMFSMAVMTLEFYRPRDWGRAVLAGLFTGAGILFSGVFWFSALG